MPIYKIQCKKCKATHEVVQTIKEGDEYLKTARCEEASEDIQLLSNPPQPAKCGGEFERLIGATSFQLQGRGWFAKGGY